MVCPHDREIKIEKKYGVRLFTHADDGTYCDLLNDFERSIEDLIVTYVKNMPEERIESAAFNSSPKYKRKVYFPFSKITDDKILQKELVDFIQSEKFDINEFCAVFGRVGLDNLQELDKNTNIKLNWNVRAQNYTPVEGLEPLKMMRLHVQVRKVSDVMDALRKKVSRNKGSHGIDSNF